MAQSGYTPIQLYRSATASAAPVAGNLTAGEIALNYNPADMALYAKNSGGSVIRIMNNPAGLKYPTVDGTSGQVIKTDGAGTLSWVTPAAGTVTSLSVVSANGFNGSFSAGATPALTLSTTVSGITYGNGSGVLGAVTVSTGLNFASGILTNTGVLSVSTASATRIVITGTTTPSVDLAASGVGVGATVGSSTLIPVITYDTYGRITAISTAANPQGTVTSVAALTIGTTGTDITSTVATGSTTPVITLNVPTASAANRGVLSTTDWSAFNGKQAALVSGTNIKTVNSNSLLGAGDVAVQATLVSGTNIKTINTNSLLGAGDVAVQATLVSGTNIKTINSASLLGSGDVAVQATLVSGTNIKTVNGSSLLGAGDVGVGVTSITASVTPAYGLSLSGGTISTSGTIAITGTLAVPVGNITATGTPSATTYLCGNGTWGTPAGAGTVTSVTGTGSASGLTLSGTGTGAVTLTLSGSVSGVSLTSAVTGTLPVANGGTNGIATPTAGAIAYGTGTAYAFTAAGTAGQVLTSAGAGTPVWSAAATGTVTNVNALTIGTTGTDLSSTVSGGTSNATITLNVPTASAANRGALSASDWSTFNNKVSAVTGTTPISVTAGVNPVVSIAAATSTTNGYLSSADWSTFNNKVSSVSGTAPVSVTAGSTPTVSMAAASNVANGYLTSTDWATFNGKQAALVSGTNIRTVNGNTLLGSSDLSVGTITGSGTTNYIPKFTSSTAIGNSLIQDNGVANVGINLAPDYGAALQVGQGGGYYGIAVYDSTGLASTNGFTALTHYSSGAFLSTYFDTSIGADTLRFGTDGTERMRIDHYGNVGIGTSNPQSILDLGAGVGRKINVYNDGTDTLIGFGIDIGGGNYELSSYAGGTGTGKGKFTWQQYNRITNTYNEVMRIDSNGNVGIGTSSPTVKLDIGGSTAFAIQASLTSGPTDPNFHLYAVNGATGNAAGTEVARFGVGYGGNASTSFSSGFSFIRGGGATDGSLAILTSASERFRISSSGAFGLSGANYGTSGQVLTSNGSGSAPTWTTVSGGGGISGSGTAGYISKFTASAAIGNSGIYNNGANSIGIGTTSPNAQFHVSGSGDGSVLGYATNALITQNDSYSWGLAIQNATAGSNYGLLNFVGDNGVTFIASGSGSGGYQSNIVYDPTYSILSVITNSLIQFAANSGEYARFCASGGLAVGTSTDTPLGAIRTTGGVIPRASSNANQTSPWAWSSASYDQQAITALANALTINADSGSPVDGQKTTFRIKDNGTGRALTWTTGSAKSFRAIGVTLPTTTVANKTVYIGCIYNAADSRWDVVSVAQEA